MKDILNEVILKLKSEKDGFCRITHKKGWLDFLKDGDFGFTPDKLHQMLRQVIKEFPPRGEKLLYLRKRCNFTVNIKNIACRPEEALERFITTSNPDKFFNQVPIGGKKEAIDIGIEESETRFVFVELKPWSSSNSPLYAIVESLKNLIEYRIIHEEEIPHHKDCKHYSEVNLIVLAPQSYWKDYGLIGSTKDKINIVKTALNDLMSEFNTNISLMQIEIEKNNFNLQCQSLKPNAENRIELSKSDAIPALARDHWQFLVSSDKNSKK